MHQCGNPVSKVSIAGSLLRLENEALQGLPRKRHICAKLTLPLKPFPSRRRLVWRVSKSV